MDGEDWPDPLPKGWTLKKYSNGKVWAHNTRTGQTFHTKKDLLRYVRYAENVLPLFANNNLPYEDSQAVADSKGKTVDDNAGESAKAFDDKEGNSEQPSDNEDANLGKGDDDDDDDDEDDDDDSLYGGLDFSKGIWGIDDVEIIERTSSHASVIVTDVSNAHHNQLPERNMKVQADQQPETKMKTKTVTEHWRNKRAGPPKKFKMPPKRFRGSGSRKNRHQKP
ncbi:uncharacterized protein LOC104877331 [Vitis vinifera]|uniref:uncharacterized protein LOC104877331 n=1 Tax=Vitis vinifera TaxID=29760 RepID=UPI00053FBC84|nr:uncharacterized protein LOC104877331 [Vitis vinifera]XP_059590431.1 uncharacterized protein LOC104877331 [Vitis vinifera]XP_059590432.1 uncharacterized protein LOC104877331 [Vitis vinifera]XP_059590433.1 uncharacterized protein LOC104877331 [Vitis vinifera]|eukprot:XP_010665427.1 PREDICTED: mitotic apparatus protein p62 isoform X2 [Vitis vinifera]